MFIKYAIILICIEVKNMGKSLERRKSKPIDYDVEKDGAKEMRYKDSYDCLYEDDELDRLESLAEIRALIEELSQEDTIGETNEEMSEGMRKVLEESEIVEDPLWDARGLGAMTINDPVQAKQAADNEDRYMIPVSDLELQEIADELDPIDLTLQKKFEEIAAELEGVF